MCECVRVPPLHLSALGEGNTVGVDTTVHMEDWMCVPLQGVIGLCNVAMAGNEHHHLQKNIFTLQ